MVTVLGLTLNKTPGLDAIPGTLCFGSNGHGLASWGNSNQVNDASVVFFTDPAKTGGLRLNSFSDTIGGLTLGNLPSGYIWSLDTSTPGQVNLQRRYRTTIFLLR